MRNNVYYPLSTKTNCLALAMTAVYHRPPILLSKSLSQPIPPVVEDMGFEPTTSGLQSPRSPS